MSDPMAKVEQALQGIVYPASGRCSDCNGNLTIHQVGVVSGRTVPYGPAVCDSCGKHYPIVEGENLRRNLAARAATLALEDYRKAMSKPMY